MHKAYAEDVLRLAARTEAKRSLKTLKLICLQAASQHFAALDMEAVLELPALLIKDLLPHLNISHLDKLHPHLSLKGISTYSAWVTILRDIKGPHRVVDIHTEEECKQEAMNTFFQLIFYGIKCTWMAKHISNVNIKSLLLAMAKNIKLFSLRPSQYLESFTAEQRPLLNVLEKSVRSVNVIHHIDLQKSESQHVLYVLHRLLDHGETKELIIHDQDPLILNWILHGRGSRYPKHQFQPRPMDGKEANSTTEAPGGEGDHGTPCKRLKLDLVPEKEDRSRMPQSPVDPQALCQTFSLPADHSAACCPRGQIESLQIRECGRDVLSVLVPFLPTWSCLRSLTLQSCSVFCDLDVLTLVMSLQQLSEASSRSLTELNIGTLPHEAFMELLLHASAGLRSLSVEIQPLSQRLLQHHNAEAVSLKMFSDFVSELPLEHLSIRVPQVVMSLRSTTCVLKRCPALTSLHIAGIRLPAGSSHQELLTCISESNQRLTRLILEDIKLTECLPEIQSLLRNCMLEELLLRDCRLLEKCSSKELCLQQLVHSLKTVSSLRSLSLAQNRLAKSLPVVAELFTGPAPSSVNHLDISSNFIQPAELLEFSRLMEKNRPPHRVTLDLRSNPWDRDRKLWSTALRSLNLLCNVQVNGWRSTDTMADHISNM